VDGLGVPTAGNTNPAGMSGMDTLSCNTELMRLARMDSPQRFRALMTNANEHNITFYPVAPLGLDTFDMSPVANRPEPGPPGARTTKEVPPELNTQRRTFRIEGLRTLASNTDGIAVVNNNDLKAGMTKVIDDVSAYYLIRLLLDEHEERRHVPADLGEDEGAQRAAQGTARILRAEGIACRRAGNDLGPRPSAAAGQRPRRLPRMEGVPEALDPCRDCRHRRSCSRARSAGRRFLVSVELPSSQARCAARGPRAATCR
jgi:hypothetical protein